MFCCFVNTLTFFPPGVQSPSMRGSHSQSELDGRRQPLPFLEQVRKRATEFPRPEPHRPLPFLEQLRRRALDRQLASPTMNLAIPRGGSPEMDHIFIGGSMFRFQYSEKTPPSPLLHDDSDSRSMNESPPVSATPHEHARNWSASSGSVSSFDQTSEAHSLSRRNSGGSVDGQTLDPTPRVVRRSSLHGSFDSIRKRFQSPSPRRKSFTHRRRSSVDLTRSEDLAMMRTSSAEQIEVSVT